MQLFPLRLRIQLVKDLKVLTIDFENKVFDSDQVLSGLMLHDKGDQLLQNSDILRVNATTNERIYEWLHNWAGLYLDVQRPLGDWTPVFSTQEHGNSLSTKAVISRVWQRLVSRYVLDLQLTHFLEKQAFMREVVEEFKTVKEFQLVAPAVRGQIKEFRKIRDYQYEVIIERERGYLLKAEMIVHFCYPERPPTFKLTMISSTSVSRNPSFDQGPQRKID